MGLTTDHLRSRALDEEEECSLNLTGKNPDVEIATWNANFGLFIAVFSWVYYFLFVVLYLLRRRSSPYLRQRLLPFVLITTLGFSYEPLWGIREYTGRNNFPCVLSDSAIHITFGLVAVPVVLRVYLFYRRVVAYKLYSQTNFVNNLKEHYINSKHTSFILERLELGQRSSFFSRIKANVKSKLEATSFTSPSTGIMSTHQGFSEASQLSSNDVANEIATTPEQKAKQKMKLRRYQIVSSPTFGYLLFVICSLIIYALAYIELEELLTCTGCESPETRQRGFIISTALYIIVVVTCMYSFYMVWHEPDPLHIKSELGWMLLLALAGIMVWTVIEAIYQDLYLDGTIYWGYILMVTFMVTFFAMVPLQIHRSYVFDNNSDDQRYDLLKFLPWFKIKENPENDVDIGLDEIMKSQSMSQQFKSHCAKEQSLENLYFWLEAENYKTRYEVYNIEERRSTFCFLHDMFIDNDGYLPINISGKMRADIKRVYDMVYKSSLETEEEKERLDQLLPKDLFWNIQLEIQSLLTLGALPRFKQTKEYRVMRVLPPVKNTN